MANKKKKVRKEKRVITRKPINIKKKKKKWANILAPKSFGNIILGESLVIDSQNLKGKRIISSLSNLNKGRNPSLKAIFEVTDIVDGNGITDLIGYFVLNSFARRIVKKGKSKIYKSFKLKTKDNVNVILKITLITKNKVLGGVERALRRELDKSVYDEITKNNFLVSLNSIIDHKLQRKFKDDMKKIYPASALEILMFRKANS